MLVVGVRGWCWRLLVKVVGGACWRSMVVVDGGHVWRELGRSTSDPRIGHVHDMRYEPCFDPTATEQKPFFVSNSSVTIMNRGSCDSQQWGDLCDIALFDKERLIRHLARSDLYLRSCATQVTNKIKHRAFRQSGIDVYARDEGYNWWYRE